MNAMLSALSQGYGVCRKDGVILIPEASGAIPAYSTQIKNAEGTLYGHFVPVPKTYLTRRGDIILFTENACDIVYLEEMYSRKIRELYEQQIKTVDDLNKSILFYGSKTPGEFSLNFIRGKFYSDRDIAVQPGHLPTHYLNSLTRHVKLSSVLRPRAPPGTGTGTGTPFQLETAVKNIKLPVPGPDVMESSDEVEEFDGTLVVKRDKREKRAPSPVDMNKLPPIQVSKKYDRPKKGGGSPTLSKVGLNSNVLGLHGTNVLPSKKDSSEIPTLPKVVSGPSAKGKSQAEWKKLGTLIGSINVLKRISESKQKEREVLKEVEEQKPVYRSAMAMDIHFLKENRRHISRGDPEAAVGGDLSLDDILLGLKDRHGNKPTLPPLQIQWSPELDKKEAQERDQERDQESAPAEVLPRKGSGDTRKSPKVFNVSSARRTSPYPKGEVRNSQSASVKKSPQAAAKSSSLDGKMISPFSEKTISRESKGEKPGSRDSKDGSRRGSGRAEEKPVEQPTMYKTNWSPDAADSPPDSEDITVDVDIVDHEYQDHVQQARRLLAMRQQQQREAEEEEMRRWEEQEGLRGDGSPNSVPALFVDDTEQVYVGEIYGDVQPDKSLNQNLPFDYMGLVRSLSRRSNNATETGELSLQSQSLGGGGSMSQSLQPGLYVMRPSNTQQPPPSQPKQPSESLEIGLGGSEGRPFTENIKRHAPRSARRRTSTTRGNPQAGQSLAPGESLAPGSSGLNVPKDGGKKSKKSGYVLREQVSDIGSVTPDHRLPQRVLHQKEPKSGYVLKKGGDHSFLDVPERQRGVRTESSKKGSGYVLKQSLPPTGVPATHDARRVTRQAKRRRNLSPSRAKIVYPSFSMDSTTRDIIGALESNEDTSKFDDGHVDTAKAIRDKLMAADPNFSLEKMNSSPKSHGDRDEGHHDAEDYLAELSRLGQDSNMERSDTEDDEVGDYYLENLDEEQYDYEPNTDSNVNPTLAPSNSRATPSTPNYQDYRQTSATSRNKGENGASPGRHSNDIEPRSKQDYIEPPLSHNNIPDNRSLYHANNMSGTPQQSYPEKPRRFGDIVRNQIGARPRDGEGEESAEPHYRDQVAPDDDHLQKHPNKDPEIEYSEHEDGNQVGYSHRHPHPNNGVEGYSELEDSQSGLGANDPDGGDPRLYHSPIEGKVQGYFTGEQFPSNVDYLEQPPIAGVVEAISPEENSATKPMGLNHLNTFLGGTPDFEIERTPGVPVRSLSPSLPSLSNSRTAQISPPDQNSAQSPRLSEVSSRMKVQNFGSTDAPQLAKLGDQRFIINPSVPYPSGPQQEAVHYTTQQLKGGYEPTTHRGVLGSLPKRKLPPHLLLRSQASTPVGRVSSSRGAANAQERSRLPSRPKSANAKITNELTAALTTVADLPDIRIGSPSTVDNNRTSLRSSSIDSGMLDGEEGGAGGLERRLDDTAENLEKIVKLRSELADNFEHNLGADLDMFSDITDSEVTTTPLRESDLVSDVAVPGLLDIPEESAEHHKGTQKKTSPLDGCHAGVYLTQLCRDGAWTNEDVPVYVTPDGKVFISSVIVNQPVCSSDRIKFAHQDDADDVHNKPEEGSLTFSDGKLTGWVKFPGQKGVKIRGKRWDPRQTGHYVIEKRIVPTEAGSDQNDENTDDRSSWQLVPLDLSIMLGGKVTMNDEPVFNPLFEENNFKLHLNENEQRDEMKCIVASFDPSCSEFVGKLSSDREVEVESSSHVTTNSQHHEVEIRGRKWNPALVGHYYCLKKSESGKWVPHSMPLEIKPSGGMVLRDIELGVPPYNGNEVEMTDLSHESLPDSIAIAFLDGKYVGVMKTDGKTEEIRGIRWDPAMLGKYSTQEKLGDSWINKSEILSIYPDGSISYDGKDLEHGFIVDNKVFVVDEGGVDSFFNNTGPISDANLSGQSFLMQRDSPVRHIAPAQSSTLLPEKESGNDSDKTVATSIQEAEIVFSSNRFYGHVSCDKDAQFVEIRGYKWDEAIVGEYFTEVLKEDGRWGGGPTITITPDGEVRVEGQVMGDTLLKDNIVSINDIKVPNRTPLQKCLFAIQDKLLTGWIQETEDSPKIQIRGSLWKEGPGAHGSYICTEKVGDKWFSSNKSVIVTPSNKVRISELGLEGDMDGLSARLERALSATASTDSVDSETVAKLRFEGDTFSGSVSGQDVETEIAGFKFDTVPGVYLLESRPLHSDQDWTGLSLQLVVSENGRISISGNAVYNVGVKDGGLHFDSDTIVKQISKLQFSDKSVTSEGLQLRPDGSSFEVEVRGSTWYPKIAGTYETELFTDSGWKGSKKIEITPQGEVLFGNELADNVRLDSDTVTFGSVDGELKDVTLAFDPDGFSGNVMTVKDQKNRVIRGKRVGTRPVSAHSATELSLGNDEEEGFNDLNGQIGSTIKRKSAGKRNEEDAAPDPAGPGVTSDYGSASDVITQQLSGSRTEALSSLEEDISMRSKSPGLSNKSEDVKIPNQNRRSAGKSNGDKSPRGSPRNVEPDDRSSSGKSIRQSPEKSKSDPRSAESRSPRGSSKNGTSEPRSSQENIDLGDISFDLDDGENSGEGGVSFETWPPKSEAEGKTDLNLDTDPGVTLDILPKGLASLGKAETKDSHEVLSPKESPESEAKAPKKSKSVAQKALTKPGRGKAGKVTAAEAEAPSSRASDHQFDQPEASGDKSAGDKSPGDKSADPELEALITPTEEELSPEASNESGMLKGSPKLPGIGDSSHSDSTLSSESPGKPTRTPDDSPRSLAAPALTKPVKLPGIDMKQKGAAAEITEDAGLLKNYIDPKGKKRDKKKKKPKKAKKTKGKNELRPDLYDEEGKGDKSGEDEKYKKKEELEASPPVDVKERARQGIEQAQARRTPTMRTPVHMAKIDRDSSRDSSPLSSGYTTPNSGHITPNNSLPQREFQGALMAAKKIRETTDQQLDGKIPSDIREHPVAEEVAEKFGMEMQVREDDTNKLSVKERRELARQKKKEEAERKRRERDEEKRRQKEEEERRLAEEEAMKQRRAEREAELAAERQRELERRKEEEARRRLAKLEERDRKKRDEEKMLDAKRKLEEELKRRRAAEAARLEEIERQKELELAREKEEQEKRMAEAEALRAQMEEEMAREMAEYERKVREEQERRRIEEALKAEAERRLLDEEERQRIIALARHLWNKGVRIEGENIEQELEISSIFYSYFNYLQSEEPYNPEIDIPYRDKIFRLENTIKNRNLDKI